MVVPVALTSCFLDNMECGEGTEEKDGTCIPEKPSSGDADGEDSVDFDDDDADPRAFIDVVFDA